MPTVAIWLDFVPCRMHAAHDHVYSTLFGSLLFTSSFLPRREFVLFNDMLLVVNKSFKFKAKIDLRMASVRNFDGRHKSQTDFEIISPAVSMQVFCRSGQPRIVSVLDS